jgi:hypothetical protein
MYRNMYEDAVEHYDIMALERKLIDAPDRAQTLTRKSAEALVLGALGICGIHRGLLNSTKVWLFRSLVVTVTDRIKLGNRRGDSHALTIQWVHVGDPLPGHRYYTTLPQGKVSYTMILFLAHLHHPLL